MWIEHPNGGGRAREPGTPVRGIGEALGNLNPEGRARLGG